MATFPEPDAAFALTTERLTLRHLLPIHAPFLSQLFSTRVFLAGLGTPPFSEEAALARLLPGGTYGDAQRDHGFGQFLVTLRDDDTRIGTVSLLYRKGISVPDIGYAFLDEFNGKGYATEASRALIAHAKQHWGVPGVVAFISEVNARSQRVAEKLGLERRGIRRLAAFQGNTTTVWAEPTFDEGLAQFGIVDVDEA